MQRTETEGVVISCDFCGTDWDPYDTSYANPMVEGHHGSVMCLSCMKRALAEMRAWESAFDCPMCLQHHEAGTEAWTHPEPTDQPGINAGAVVCRPCIRQAAGRFNKDNDVAWKWEH